MEVLLTDPVHEDAVRLLQQVGTVSVARSTNADDLREAVADASVIVARSRLPADILDFAPKVRVIARHGIGLDFVPIEEATVRGVPVVFVPDSSVQAVAEHTVAVMLQLTRHLCRLDQNVRSGRWQSRNELLGGELQGKTLGVVGFGRIGSRVASMCHQAFGMNVLALIWPGSQPVVDGSGYTFTENLDEVLEAADFLSLHVPLTGETVGMIGERELRRLKPTAYLINVARGAVVDEAALIRALQEEWLAGAAIDVFAQQPVSPENPLLAMDKVLLTPHSASLTRESFKRTGLAVARDVLRVLSGERPTGIANPQIYDR